MENLSYYKILGDLFRYPDKEFQNYSQHFLDLVATEFPEKIESLRTLVGEHNKLQTYQQQEYYLRTFDVQAVCYLDLGYVLFGEDYKRAQLLVNLQNEHKLAGVDCGTELGDFLPNVLTLLSQTQNREFVEEFGFIVITPAIRFMLMKFKNNNFYKEILEILLLFLQGDFKGDQLAEYAVPEHAFNGDNDFLMPSPKSAICDTHCNKRKSFKS